MSYRVFVDANVWYPPSPRALFLGAAMAGAFEVRTSHQVLDEMHRHVERRYDEALATARVDQLAAALEAVQSGSVIDLDDYAAPEPIGLPDPDDEHVVAAALASGADGLVTFNLKDFPVERLDPVGLELCPPDLFAGEGLAARHPTWVRAVQLALQFPPQNVRSAADLGLRLYDCQMQESAGMLLGADWSGVTSQIEDDAGDPLGDAAPF